VLNSDNRDWSWGVKSDAATAAVWKRDLDAASSKPNMKLIEHARESRRSESTHQSAASRETAVPPDQMFTPRRH
jgi:hypothetical protein